MIRPALIKNLVLLLLPASPMHAADHTTRWFIQPTSKVLINGTSNLHEWNIEARDVSGFAEFGAAFPVRPNQAVKLGKIKARIEVTIPVRSLHSGSDGRWLDGVIYRQLEAENHPRIVFRLGQFILQKAPSSKQGAYSFNSQAELVVAGTTNQISLPLSVLP